MQAEPGGDGEVLLVPVDRRPVRAGLADRKQRLSALVRMQGAEPLLVGAVLLVEAHAPVAVEQGADHPDDPRRVEHVQRSGWLYSGAIRTAVCCFDVVAPPIRSGSSIPRRSISFATWTISSSDGVIRPERPDDVAVLLERGVEDPVGRDHDAEVDDLVAVAAEHDADDVLADVVHVALHRREHDARRRRRARLLRFHERLQVRDRPLHRARALHDLRQEHLPRAEEVADDRHPVHQRPFDDVERTRGFGSRLLGVLLDEVDDPVDERVREAFADRGLAPREVDLPLASLRPSPVRARSTSRSVASGRRSKSTSSTRSSRSASMSS